MTWWSDFDNPTLNHKGARSVRTTSRCVLKAQTLNKCAWKRVSVHTPVRMVILRKENIHLSQVGLTAPSQKVCFPKTHGGLYVWKVGWDTTALKQIWWNKIPPSSKKKNSFVFSALLAEDYLDGNHLQRITRTAKVGSAWAVCTISRLNSSDLAQVRGRRTKC